MKVERASIVLAVIAAGSVALVHAGDAAQELPGFVSTRSAAKRLLPQLADVSSGEVAIELAPSGGDVIRIEPEPHGLALLVAGQRVGPADPQAADGLLSSLRMATTLRAVSAQAELPAATRGRISLELADRTLSVDVGGPTPDGVGLYGTLEVDGASQVWVVERELGQILDQLPRAWLAARAVVAEPGEVTSLRLRDATLARGADGLWRGDALLGTETVDARLSRVLAARMQPVLDEGASDPGELWIEGTLASERTFALRLHGPCPGHDERVVLSRGPGWRGCIDRALTKPWPLQSIIEPRLAPHGYGRLLSIEQRTPAPQQLRRQPGGWVLEIRDADGVSSTKLTQAAVFEWYGTLHDAELAPLDQPSADVKTDVELVIATDTTANLRIACGVAGGRRVCRRDEGPWLELRDDVVLAFEVGTFASRRLTEFDPIDAMAIELVPGVGREGVRQALHFDFGVWRLDTPEHPDGDTALSDLALEDLLSAASGARADAWVDAPGGEPIRKIRIELTPSRSRPDTVALELYDDCVVTHGGRSARVSESTCARLSAHLLRDDPLRQYIDTARALEIERAGTSVRLRRDGDHWLRDSGESLGDLAQELERLGELKATALNAGNSPGAVRLRLRVLPERGAAINIEVGRDWARIEGQAWWYVLG